MQMCLVIAHFRILTVSAYFSKYVTEVSRLYKNSQDFRFGFIEWLIDLCITVNPSIRAVFV